MSQTVRSEDAEVYDCETVCERAYEIIEIWKFPRKQQEMKL